MLWEILQNSQEKICAGISFLVFSCEFCETCNLQNSTGRLLLNIAGSTVLVNETVNYDTKTKAYVLICVRIASYSKGQLRWKNRFQKQSFTAFKLGVLKNFVNSSGKRLCRSLFLIKLQTSCNSIKKKLQHRCFPVKFAKFLRTPFLQKSSSGCFWGLSRVFEGVRGKNRCDGQQ